MCRYTTATITYRQCTRGNRHTVEKRYYKKCDKAKPGVYCQDAVYDPGLGVFGGSTRAGPCPHCRDSGTSTGTVTYESVSVDFKALNVMLLTNTSILWTKLLDSPHKLMNEPLERREVLRIINGSAERRRNNEISTSRK